MICFQAQVDELVGGRPQDDCRHEAELSLMVGGYPPRNFCRPCADRLLALTNMEVTEGPVAADQAVAPPPLNGPVGQIGQCGKPGCEAPATWMITLDYGGSVGEGGACDEHLPEVKSFANFVTAEPWVDPVSGDNPLQAKMRIQLLGLENVPEDYRDEANAAIDAENYAALDRVLARIDKLQREAATIDARR